MHKLLISPHFPIVKMIIITGASGFIGSCIAKQLYYNGNTDLILVDKADLSKSPYLKDMKYKEFVAFDEFLKRLEAGHYKSVQAIIHMGACSSTTVYDKDFLKQNNFVYTKRLFDWCTKNNSRLIYASSAATYGDGSNGYSDDVSKIKDLKPLNPYGESKQMFDMYALDNVNKPIQWVGLKFFNVYGPNEYHKETMASVIFHSFNQIKKEGKVRLFKSYKKGFKDGEQMRDFVYVKDVVSVVLFFLEHKEINGIFNVGTGKARSFKDLVSATFTALDLKPNIEYIEMPDALKDKYQYFTEAEMAKLKKAGYTKEFMSLEEGAKDYVVNYLDKGFSSY